MPESRLIAGASMSAPDFFRSITFNPVFDMAACIRCMRCMRACPMGLISYGEGKLSAQPDRCRNCRACVKACDNHAIQISMRAGGPNAGHLKKDLT